MSGWFIAATAGACTDCRRATRIGERVLHPADLPDDVRLCTDCATAPTDLLELLAMEAS